MENFDNSYFAIIEDRTSVNVSFKWRTSVIRTLFILYLMCHLFCIALFDMVCVSLQDFNHITPDLFESISGTMEETSSTAVDRSAKTPAHAKPSTYF